MKRKDVDQFEKTQSQLQGFYDEVAALSKKTPTGGLNTFKLKFINQVLEKANLILKDKYRPFPDFKIFNLEDIPSNSDVVFILSQYLGCMEKFRSDNIFNSGGWWYWITDEDDEDEDDEGKIRTRPPDKIGKD